MENKKYKLVLFDMDGTLADTSPGILNCHKFANVKMGRPEPTNEDLEGIIGGPLLKTYISRFAFSETDAKKAVEIYRNRYAEQGIFEANLYDGIAETLSELKNKGYLLAVATLKAEIFAKQMLERMNVAHLFDVIHGVDLNDKITKSGLIDLCLTELNILPENAVLVGDSIHDYEGAQQSNIDFIGVLYGFGFKSNDEIDNNHTYINSPKELLNVL